MTKTVRVHKGSGWCVTARGEQDHGRHHIRTTSQTEPYCTAYQRNAGQIGHHAQWFVNGRYCAYIDPIYSNYAGSAFETNILQDVWPLCNNGSGVHVTISMDTWNYAQGHTRNSWYPPWGGPGVRPITWHCHCP